MTDAQRPATGSPDPLPRMRSGAGPFSVTVTRNPAGCVLVAVVGEVDLASLGEFAHALARQPSSETTAVVVDLSRVSFCSVGGFAVLVGLRQRVKRVGVPLALVVDVGSVRRALEVLGLATLFTLHVDRVSALAGLNPSGSPAPG